MVHVPSEPQVSLYSISRSELVGVHRTRTLMICCTSRCCPWISRLAQKALNTSVHSLLLGVFATEDLVEQVTAWSITKRSCGSKKSLAGKYILMHYSTFAYLLLRAPQKLYSAAAARRGKFGLVKRAILRRRFRMPARYVAVKVPRCTPAAWSFSLWDMQTLTAGDGADLVEEAKTMCEQLRLSSCR